MSVQMVLFTFLAIFGYYTNLSLLSNSELIHVKYHVLSLEAGTNAHWWEVMP